MQFRPITEALTWAFSWICVEDPISVLFPTLHVLVVDGEVNKPFLMEDVNVPCEYDRIVFSNIYISPYVFVYMASGMVVVGNQRECPP